MSTTNTQTAANTQAGKTAGQPRVGGKLAAKPRPLNQVAAKKDEAFATLHILPSCVSDVSELAGNAKALELAGKLAQAEKDLKAATSEVGSLRARITQSDTRVAELAREKSVVEGQLSRAQANATTLEDTLNIAQVQLRSTAEEKTTLAGQADKWRTCYEGQTETLAQREHLLSQISVALGNKDEWDNALPMVKALKASDRNNGELRQEIHGLKLRIENLAEDKQALIAANETLGNEVDRLIADSPRLPLWARAMAALVALIAVGFVAHKMGFESHAALTGGAR